MTRSVCALILIATLVAGQLLASPAAAFTGAISGTVTDGVGNGLICQVNVWGPSSVIASIVSNPDGTYSIGGLADGTYAVSVATGGPRCSGFADEYWQNKPDGASSDPVVVSGGGTTTGINIALGDGTKGAIRGHVTNTGGTPLNGCVVDAINTSTGAVTFSQTALSLQPDGTYFITPLDPGTYKVRFRACNDGARFYGSEFYADQADLASADPVTVTAGVNSVGIDGTLTASTPGGVSGTVSDGAGNGLACQVNFWDELNTFTGSVYSSTVDGSYLKNDLPAGTYRVQVVTGLPTCSSLFSSEWYQDSASAGTADPVIVTAGATTTNIDVALGNGTTGAIRGHVTSTTGTPLNGCMVDAVNAATGAVTTSQTSLISRPDGAYTLTPLVAGSYKVRFRACTDGSFYGGEFYNDRADLATADVVTVTGGVSTGGIDGLLAIATPGAISGMVRDAAGAFYVCQINFWDELSALAGSRFSSGSNGTFLFDSAAPGSYRVQVNACGSYPSEWYQDQTSFASATAVVVTTGATRAGVNIVLGTPTPTPTVSASTSTVTADPATVIADGAATSTVTVTVNDSTSSPIAGATVTLTGTGGSTISTASGASSSLGVVTFMVKSTTVERVTYTATAGGVPVTQTAVVAFTPATPAPTVTAIAPTSGSTAGGTVVTITGTGFSTTATTVSFGATATTAVGCASTTTCVATSPLHAAGAVDVVVTIAGRSSPPTAAGLFTYTAKQDQTITFAPPADRILGEPPFTVTATASSGLAVTFVASGPCSVSGSTVTLATTGVCAIAASQAGNSTFKAAPNVSRTFDVLSPAQFAQRVIAAISGMGLPSGTATSLTSKLRAYLTSSARGNQTAACGQLGAFVNHVNAQSGKQIPAIDAALLLEEARRLGAVLRCR